MADTIDQESVEDYRKTEAKRKGIILFFFFVAFFVLCFFVYGFESSYYKLTQAQQSSSEYRLPILFFSTMFTLLGFGLILSSFKESKISGLGIAFFVVTFNYLLGPLWHQAWFQACFYNQNGKAPSPPTNASEYWLRSSNEAMSPSELSFKLANLCSVSFFIALSGRSGRSTLLEVFSAQFIFNFFWYLNLNVNTLLSENNPLSLVYFDDYGTYLVYLFGAVFGLIICLLNKTERRNQNMKSDIPATIYYFLGTAFLFGTFAYASTDIINLGDVGGQKYKQNAGPANIWFSMFGSVAGVYATSMLFNNGRVGAKQASFGCVVGAIMAGAGAGYLENAGACLLMGLIAGVLTTVLISTVVQRMNQDDIVDSHGFIIPILVICFIGGFIIWPCIIIRYYTLGVEGQTLYTLGQSKLNQYEPAGYQLGYFGVTLAFSLVAGLIAGFILKLTKEEYTDFSDYKIFSDNFGLYEEDRKSMLPLKAAGNEEKEGEAGREHANSDKNLMPDVV